MPAPSAKSATGPAEARPPASPPPPLHPLLIDDVVRAALQEDLGRAGDITSAALFPPDQTAQAALTIREAGTLAGLDVVSAVFRLLDPAVTIARHLADGTTVAANTPAATLMGPARSLLTGERVALNFFGRMSGIATLTAAYVAKLEGLPTRIACTRKTTPGLRLFEKYAVRAGGGRNHRFGLDDAVMIKDNHIAVAGSIAEALARVRAEVGHTVTLEVEADTLEQASEAAEEGADVILLDNMDLETLRAAVSRIAGRAITEASGGVSLETVRAIAETGVDVISVGALTHSARVLDVAFDMPPAAPR
ncbi:MAG: carboxylating nicotinate-nucleotide diphosphorylase [Pseudomonadota bacterium]